MARDAKVDEGRDDDEGASGWRNTRVSRRAFLRTGTLGAAAVGVAGAVPGLSSLLGEASTDAPALPDAAAGADTLPALSAPIVAHVTDAAAGQLSIYVGEREVTFQDRVLVQHLLRAVR
jgi:hypothetical protein